MQQGKRQEVVFVFCSFSCAIIIFSLDHVSPSFKGNPPIRCSVEKGPEMAVSLAISGGGERLVDTRIKREKKKKKKKKTAVQTSGSGSCGAATPLVSFTTEGSTTEEEEEEEEEEAFFGSFSDILLAFN